MTFHNKRFCVSFEGLLLRIKTRKPWDFSGREQITSAVKVTQIYLFFSSVIFQLISIIVKVVYTMVDEDDWPFITLNHSVIFQKFTQVKNVMHGYFLIKLK